MGEASVACFAGLVLAIRNTFIRLGCEGPADIAGFTQTELKAHASTRVQLHVQAREARTLAPSPIDAKLFDVVPRQAGHTGDKTGHTNRHINSSLRPSCSMQVTNALFSCGIEDSRTRRAVPDWTSAFTSANASRFGMAVSVVRAGRVSQSPENIGQCVCAASNDIARLSMGSSRGVQCTFMVALGWLRKHCGLCGFLLDSFVLTAYKTPEGPIPEQRASQASEHSTPRQSTWIQSSQSLWECWSAGWSQVWGMRTLFYVWTITKDRTHKRAALYLFLRCQHTWTRATISLRVYTIIWALHWDRNSLAAFSFLMSQWWCLRLANLGRSLQTTCRSPVHHMSSGTRCGSSILWKRQRQQRLTFSGASSPTVADALQMSSTERSTLCNWDNTSTSISKAPAKEPMFDKYNVDRLGESAHSQRLCLAALSLLHSREDKACHARMTTLVFRHNFTQRRFATQNGAHSAVSNATKQRRHAGYLHRTDVLLHGARLRVPLLLMTCEKTGLDCTCMVKKHEPFCDDRTNVPGKPICQHAPLSGSWETGVA